MEDNKRFPHEPLNHGRRQVLTASQPDGISSLPAGSNRIDRSEDEPIDLVRIVAQAELDASPQARALTISLDRDDELIELTEIVEPKHSRDDSDDPIELTDVIALPHSLDDDDPIELMDVIALSHPVDDDGEVPIELTDIVAAASSGDTETEGDDADDVIVLTDIVAASDPYAGAEGATDGGAGETPIALADVFGNGAWDSGDEENIEPAALSESAQNDVDPEMPIQPLSSDDGLLDLADIVRSEESAEEFEWVDISDIDLPDAIPDGDLPSFLKNRGALEDEPLELSNEAAIGPIVFDAEVEPLEESAVSNISLASDKDLEDTLAKLELLMKDSFLDDDGEGGPESAAAADQTTDPTPQTIPGLGFADFPIGIDMEQESGESERLPDEHLAALLEQLIRTRYGQTIEQLIAATVERIVTREVEAIKRALLEDEDPID